MLLANNKFLTVERCETVIHGIGFKSRRLMLLANNKFLTVERCETVIHDIGFKSSGQLNNPQKNQFGAL